MGQKIEGAVLVTKRASGFIPLPSSVLRPVAGMNPVQEAIFVREELRQRSIKLAARVHDLGAFHQMAVRLGMEPRPGGDSLLGPMGRAYAKRLAVANTVRAGLEAYTLAGRGKARLIAKTGPSDRTAVEINLSEMTPYVAITLEQMFLAGKTLDGPKSESSNSDVVGFWPWVARGAAAIATSPVVRRVAGKTIAWTAAGLGIGWGADKINDLLTSDERMAMEAVTMKAIAEGRLPELMELRLAEAKLAAQSNSGFMSGLGSTVGTGLAVLLGAFVIYRIATKSKSSDKISG